MSECVFRFWNFSTCIYDERSGCFTHPEDRAVFARRVEHGFCLKCLPGNWIGPLKTAKLVLLFLSPGLADMDLDHPKTNDGRAYYKRQWEGKASLPSEDDHRSAWDWWTPRVSSLLNAKGLMPINHRNLMQTASQKVAILNMAAYKSEKFDDHHLLAALPSSRCAVSWAHETLFPKAIAGETMVVCLRSAKWWGLNPRESGQKYGKALYVPKTTPGGYIQNNSNKKQKIKLEIARNARKQLGL